MIADAALYLPFALIPGLNAPLVVLVVVAGIIAEMAGALGPMLGVKRCYAGPLGKSDRAFAFGLLAVLLGGGHRSGPMEHALSRGDAAALRADHAQSRSRHRRRGEGQPQGQGAMSPVFGIPANVVYATAGIYARAGAGEHHRVGACAGAIPASAMPNSPRAPSPGGG